MQASVIALWTQMMGQADRSALGELTRFNEATTSEFCSDCAIVTPR